MFLPLIKADDGSILVSQRTYEISNAITALLAGRQALAGDNTSVYGKKGDVFSLVSNYESWGVAPSEAMATKAIMRRRARKFPGRTIMLYISNLAMGTITGHTTSLISQPQITALFRGNPTSIPNKLRKSPKIRSKRWESNKN